MYRRYFRFERKQKEHFWNHDDAVSFRGWITCLEEQNTHLWKMGTGKSKLAIEIGKRFGGKILSADSMHVYKGIDILADKVTAEELSECPKHLIIENKYRGYYTVARRYEFYFRVATIFYERAQRVSKIFFLPFESKIHIFKTPCNVLFII